MSADPKRGWRIGPLVRESLVIIGSILIAFGIDAWWDTQSEQAQSRAFLEALREDFAAASVELERVRDLHQGIVDATADIMRWSDLPSPEAGCRASPDPYTYLLVYPTFDPPEGTIETILASGRADLVDDPELRRELTRWTARVEDLRREEEYANEHLADHLFPILRDSLDLKQVVRVGPYVWPEAGDDPIPCTLVASRPFQSTVYRHWNWHQSALQEGIPPLTTSIEVITRLVDEQLAR